MKGFGGITFQSPLNYVPRNEIVIAPHTLARGAAFDKGLVRGKERERKRRKGKGKEKEKEKEKDKEKEEEKEKETKRNGKKQRKE